MLSGFAYRWFRLSTLGVHPEITHLEEHRDTPDLTDNDPRAEKYLDRAVLLTMKLRVP